MYMGAAETSDMHTVQSLMICIEVDLIYLVSAVQRGNRVKTANGAY